MKGKTQPMIKKLLLLPLVVMLSGCTNDLSVKKNEKLLSTYYNVAYTFNYDYMQYDVITDTMVYNVKPENFYNIYVSEYKLIDPNGNKYHEENQIVDELLIYKTTKKLYVYRLI